MGQVSWYGDELRAEFRVRTKKVLYAAGLQVVAEAQVNISDNGQVDTGFMRLSGYANSGDESTYSETNSSGRYRNRDGEIVARERGPERDPESDVEVVAGFAAEYALFEEQRRPYLYNALESVGRQLDKLFEEQFSD